MSRGRALALGAVTLVAAAVVFSQPPIPQDPGYHHFAADGRGLAGIPNWENVLSNGPFLLVGAAGLRRLAGRWRAAGAARAERGAWLGLFLGLVLTAFGSAFYHWNPTNDTLLWDRLPMALGFTAFLAGMLGERLGHATYRAALWPLIGLGVASVLFWWAGERQGHGDLRLYVLVQYFPLLLIPLMMVLYEPRYSHGRYVLYALGAYGAAKLLEVYDAAIFAATGGAFGGHALKHLAAAAGCWLLYRMHVIRSEVAAPGS